MSFRPAKNNKNGAKPYQNNQYSYKSSSNKLRKLEIAAKTDAIDQMMGFDRFDSGQPRTGWLVNFHATVMPSETVIGGHAACDFYFLDQEGGSFKTTVLFKPYFFVSCRNDKEMEVEETLKKIFDNLSVTFETVKKEDLSMPNHLKGLRKRLLKLSFVNLQELQDARQKLKVIVESNEKELARDMYRTEDQLNNDPLEFIEDIKEYDVPYHVRVAIDLDLRVGKWYEISVMAGNPSFAKLDIVAPADPVILAFDIETTKAPLKFPDAAIDQVMMISYMIDGEGFLITNRAIVAADIDDFEYTPKPEYKGQFTIFNEENEFHLLRRFFDHIKEVKPTVIATFNGDFFDWPFVDARAAVHGLSLYDEIGFQKDMENEYKSPYCAHMDCYRWVKRDSYLPQGSQGLKAVTTVKLGYNPLELDPELMTPYAVEQPQILAEYSVSDAVATYYLYYNYVHPFIFSLATIIPLNGDEVLRKGTGTLCEMLLMVQAFEHEIVLPNKHKDPLERFYHGHVLEQETYVGGHVESLEAGVFRSDLATKFDVNPDAVDEMVSKVEDVVDFFVETEWKKNINDVVNREEVVDEIKQQLYQLKEQPKRKELPLIYHVDVASMYPNIMISNRLQPDSIKEEQDCAACDFNVPGKKCDRSLPWAWRGEYYPAKMDDYHMLKRAMLADTVMVNGVRTSCTQLNYQDQVAQLKKRLSDYSRKVYHRIKSSETVERDAVICQRENPFYIDTVRDFRDRRYTYKGLAKKWKKKIPTHGEDAVKLAITYDSLQLAHKVILNSFYGYVMRKGSRWYSMEMAGVTCLTGATIIQMARAMIEQFGRPLELDTDGIWCIIPKSFPDTFKVKTKDGDSSEVSFLCSYLNYTVHQKFTNHQYQIKNSDGGYTIQSENSIFFELDGPYRAMILPASKEEGRGIKKRYAVFEDDGSLAELKGFELKRRGELEIVKNMQSDLFPAFLEGGSLESCYASVAAVANRWLDVVRTKGSHVEDEDLINLIGERKSMSKSIKHYAGMKSASITTVQRLVEFLDIDTSGESGVTAHFVIAAKPAGAPVAQRAVPIAIFSADITQKRRFLRKWLKDPSLDDFDPRKIIDWNYYYERLASVVLKIISIPAYFQIKKNPCDVEMPAWVTRTAQQTLDGFFNGAAMGKKPEAKLIEEAPITEIADIEDFGAKPTNKKEKNAKKSKKNKRVQQIDNQEELDQEILALGCPDPAEDYVGWLNYNKVIWRQNDAARAANRKIFGEHAGGRGIGRMMKDTAKQVNIGDWHVLSYTEIEPGLVEAKVLMDGKIKDIKLRNKKKVYLSFDGDADALIAENRLEKTKNTLAHGNKVVYQKVMDEHEYEKQIQLPGSVLRKARVHESNISSQHRMVLDLGAVIKYTSKELGGLYKGLQFGFNPANFSTSSPTPYLHRQTLDIVYVDHVLANKYEVFAIYCSWSSHVSFHVLKPSERAADFDVNSITESYEKVFASENPENTVINHYSTFASLNRSVNQKIASIHEEKSATAVLALQTPFFDRVQRTVRAISSFAVLQVRYEELVLPALKWQNALINKFLETFKGSAQWLDDLVKLARYCNVPLCHVDISDAGFLLDVVYGRRLSQNGIVLWWGDSPESTQNPDSLAFPGINIPDSYESVSIEVSVQNLTVNTVLTSSLINEAEGSDLDGLVENDFGRQALSVLRGLVKEWWDDAVASSPFGDLLVSNLAKWIQRKGSYLYEPRLEYHIHNLAKKTILQMVREFKKLGATAIFTSRGKMIFNTSKTSIANSYAYSQYILKAIRTKSLFNYLDMQIVRYWDLLVWMDEFNYGGRACYDVKEGDQELIAFSQWNIAKHLPPIYQGEFHDWVGVFLDGLLQDKSNYSEKSKQIASQGDEEKENEGDEDHVTKISAPLAAVWHPILKRIKKLYSKQISMILSDAFKNEYAFPELPGSHLKLENPTLELVKSVCAVFSLSKVRTLEARSLRKQLLSILDVPEFSPEAQFKNPSVSLKIPQVLCSCGALRDVDLCRDDGAWSCEVCSQPYNKVAIEERLIEEYARLVAEYYIQDLKCSKCGRIREQELSMFCSCSGQWVGVVSRSSMMRSAQIFENVAVYFDLRMLQGAI